jgi:hypothetical protein
VGASIVERWGWPGTEGAPATSRRLSAIRCALATRTGRLFALARAHRAFSVALGCAALLRLLATLAYREPFWFDGDSFAYVHTAVHPVAGQYQPSGYPLILWALRPFHSLTVVVVVQHLAGLALGTLVYSLVRRYRGSAARGVLAAAPILFDAFWLQAEHSLLSETWFTLALVGAFAVAFWHPGARRLSIARGASVGLLFAAAVLIRLAALPLLPVLLICLICSRVGWRATVACSAAAGVLLLSYACWFQSENQRFALGSGTGAYLWARTAAFSDCNRINPPANERWLCFAAPPQARVRTSMNLWLADSPIRRARPTSILFTPETNKLAGDFAKRAVLAQPGAYTRTVFDGVGKAFSWGRTDYPSPLVTKQYYFPAAINLTRAGSKQMYPKLIAQARQYQGRVTHPVVTEPWAGMVRGYQRLVYLRGPLLAAILALAAGLMALRRPPGVPAVTAFLLATGLLLVPIMTADFDYRYLLPVFPFATLAAALVTAPRVPHSECPNMTVEYLT